MADSFWYPSVDDVLAIHEDIVSEYPDTEEGVRRRGDIEFLDYIQEGHLDATTERIHVQAFHLLRLLVANHPFVDANKRTALNTTTVFYALNGHRFTYDDEIRSILEQFATDEASVDPDSVIAYLELHTESFDLADDIEAWREDLLEYGLDRLTGDREYPND